MINISNISNYMGQKILSNNKKDENSTSFEDFYNKAVEFTEETNKLAKNAEKLGSDFAVGKTDDIHSVMIAQEKAYVALQFTVQVRDKMLGAYNEIMRMQV